MRLLVDFKRFLLRGNVVDLAVAVVIGVAFTAVITSFVQDLLTPLIAATVGQPDFSGLTFTLRGSIFRYGAFINSLLAFVLVSSAVFFFVVVPVNALIARSRHEPPADPTTKKCDQCLSEIPIGARRCAYCTSEVAVGS
jgi:large conductance mechanosensitive channel